MPHVNDRREAESASVLLGCVDTGPPAEHLWGGGRGGRGTLVHRCDGQNAGSTAMTRSGQELSVWCKWKRHVCLCVCVNVFVAWVFECGLCVVRMVGGCECVCELYISKM